MEMMTAMALRTAMGRRQSRSSTTGGRVVRAGRIARVAFPSRLRQTVRNRLAARGRAAGALSAARSRFSERNGVRVGIVGVMGATRVRATPSLPSKITGHRGGVPRSRSSETGRPPCGRSAMAVDVVVVLGHQGLPGAMQTDAENDPDVQRPLDGGPRLLPRGRRDRRLTSQPIPPPPTNGLEESPDRRPADGDDPSCRPHGYGTRLGDCSSSRSRIARWSATRGHQEKDLERSSCRQNPRSPRGWPTTGNKGRAGDRGPRSPKPRAG
jgi:hypothetical protein